MVNIRNVVKTLGTSAVSSLITGYAINGLLSTDEEKADTQDRTIEVHTLTYNEEDYIRDSMESLVRQPLYQDSEDVRLVLVDSNSDDNTVRLAESFVDEVWNAPDGKVPARDFAYRKSDADIVVHTDADVIYPEYWLSNLIRPIIENDQVVATHGPSLTYDPAIKPFLALYAPVDRARRKMMGHNVAVERSAYIREGGFDRDLDHTDFSSVQEEEEFGLYQMMDRQGDIVWVWTAPVYRSERRLPISYERLSSIDRSEDFKKQLQNNERFSYASNSKLGF